MSERKEKEAAYRKTNILKPTERKHFTDHVKTSLNERLYDLCEQYRSNRADEFIESNKKIVKQYNDAVELQRGILKKFTIPTRLMVNTEKIDNTLICNNLVFNFNTDEIRNTFHERMLFARTLNDVKNILGDIEKLSLKDIKEIK